MLGHARRVQDGCGILWRPATRMSIASTFVERANVELRTAPAALQPYIGCFWIVDADRGAKLHFIPDGYSSIWCEIRGDRVEWYLRGPLTGPADRRFHSSATLAGVRLRPGVPSLLTNCPVDRIVDRRIRLANTAWARPLVTGRFSDAAPAARLDLLERFLAERLAGAQVHPVVATAVAAIQLANGQASIGAIAASSGVSARHLTRLMRAWTGLAPKAFARIVRFQSTLAAMADTPREPLASVAASNGFFDQAHLSGDVARLAAVTPASIVRHSMSEFSKTRCE
jgi:AraC-like DNA-binding protein